MTSRDLLLQPIRIVGSRPSPALGIFRLSLEQNVSIHRTCDTVTWLLVGPEHRLTGRVEILPHCS